MARSTGLGRISPAVIVVATAFILIAAVVSPRPDTAAAQAAQDGLEVLAGRIDFHADGAGANGDGLVNALFSPPAITSSFSSYGMVGDLFAPMIGADPDAAAASIEGAYGPEVPVEAAYDATIDFRLKSEDGLHWSLDSGSITWSADSTSSINYEGGSIHDSYHGHGIERLDPETDRIDATLSRSDPTGAIDSWGFDMEVVHDYESSGQSVWEFGGIGKITVGRLGDDMTLKGETPFGNASDLGMPTLLEGVFSDNTYSVGWAKSGKIKSLSHPIDFSDSFEIVPGSGRSITVGSYATDCAPSIVREDHDGLRVYDSGKVLDYVFNDAGALWIKAELEELPKEYDRDVKWKFTVAGVDVGYTPDDAVGQKVEIFVPEMPPDNNGFGDNSISVEYTDSSVAEQCAPVAPAPVRLFFPLNGEATDSGHWNWFEYWLQTPADASMTGIVEKRGGACEETDGLYYLGGDSIYLCKAAASDSAPLRLDPSRQVDFIDNVAATVRHEDQHRRNWRRWHDFCTDTDGDGVPDPAEGCFVDVDGDTVPDDEEPGISPAGFPLDPTTKFSCRDVRGSYVADLDDEHCIAYGAELQWSIDSIDELDWAHPGSQWP